MVGISPQCEPFRFDHWSPGLRCLSYAQRRIDEMIEAKQKDNDEEAEAWKNES